MLKNKIQVAKSELPPLLAIPLGSPLQNARMDLHALETAVKKRCPLESPKQVKMLYQFKILIVIAALTLALAKTFAPQLVENVPGWFVQTLLYSAVFLTAFRWGEFFVFSATWWRRKIYYLLVGLSIIAFLMAPSGHQTTLATTVFMFLVLLPPLYGGIMCIKDLNGALNFRQLKRYQATLSTSDKAEFLRRTDRNLEAL